MKRPPHILLINPWITDFSAYNFWMKPLGLLRIASLLRVYGFQVTLIDCLDFYEKVKIYGDGKFYKTKISKPLPLKSIPRHYSRYGIPEEILLKRLSSIVGKPDLIGVTSGMTYWYPGVFQVIHIVKELFKSTPVILGGIYAALCDEHAETLSGADVVFKCGNESDAVHLISELTQFKIIPDSKPRTPQVNYPAFDLYPHLDYIGIATSKGCPFRCAYCASPVLSQGFSRKEPQDVVEEIEYWTTRNRVKNIAFCDDALLVDSSNHFIPIMKELVRRGIDCNFHTPNALHIREIGEEVAHLLFRGGFKTIRLGLETSDEKTQRETGGKVGNEEFQKAVKNLNRAGYQGKEIGVYVMAGLPGQRAKEVEESIAFVRKAGARPVLVEYSPIPKTPLFEKAKLVSSFDLEHEPLFHNNSILPCQWEGFTPADFRRLKQDVKRRD